MDQTDSALFPGVYDRYLSQGSVKHSLVLRLRQGSMPKRGVTTWLKARRQFNLQYLMLTAEVLLHTSSNTKDFD